MQQKSPKWLLLAIPFLLGSSLNIVGGLIPPWIGWLLMAISILLTAYHLVKNRGPSMLPVIGIVVSFLALVGFSAWYYLDKAKSPIATASQYLPKPLTLKNLFYTDFITYAGLRTTTELELGEQSKLTGEKRNMPWKAIWDREAKSMFLAFYIEAYPADSRRAISQCKFILENYQKFLDEAVDPNHSIEYLSPNRNGETDVISVKDLTFTGQIYLYISDFLTTEQQAEITKSFKEKKLSAFIRSEYYRQMHAQEDRFAALAEK
jgi:hypothetical protein